jgi:hypothetical protein
MANNATKVFQNRHILTQIFNFLGNDNIQEKFLPTSNKQILIYGQVQSGKTSKIMEHIKKTTVATKILLIQNSLSMLTQYERALTQNCIPFSTISKPNINPTIRNIRLNKNRVLLVMNNNYRRDMLAIIMNICKITNNYSLMMDESDMYYKTLMNSSLYKNATECVHITATPFSSKYRGFFDDVTIIPPKEEYISLKKLDIEFIPDVECEYDTIMKILKDDFVKKREGIMLITIHHRISKMESLSRYLAKKFIDIPIVLLSSTNILYFNNLNKALPKMSISEVITGLENHSHIIFIANRLATRGINYSDLTYTRHLTHQVITKNDNKTNFIQRCRILGNKKGITEKLKLYCLNCDEKYFEKILQTIEHFEKNFNNYKLGYVPKKKPAKKILEPTLLTQQPTPQPTHQPTQQPTQTESPTTLVPSQPLQSLIIDLTDDIVFEDDDIVFEDYDDNYVVYID